MIGLAGGSIIHIAPGLVVHLCHCVAHLPGPVMVWHTREGAYVELQVDPVGGCRKVRVILNVNQYLTDRGEEFLYVNLTPDTRMLLGRSQAQRLGIEQEWSDVLSWQKDLTHVQ